ncbi:hypothetical protein AB0J74_09635 [Asanoa sp. NPDC049573]|uniref:WXG100-like domain-containing protein n=1 Tax=Asanoa sp. NPDC049573 TaxID=3155396 RepID=UPI003424EF7F
MTVLPSPIPHPLDALPWDVPGWAYECLEWVIGVEWPAGDERAVWDLADAWSLAGTALATARLDSGAAASAVAAGYAGPAAEAFGRAWQQFDAGALGPLPGAFDEVASLVSSCAAEIEAAKIEVWIEVGLLVIELLALGVAMALTAGAATPAATAAATATRAAIQRIFGRLVVRLGREAESTLLARIARRSVAAGFAEAAQEVGADGGTQSYQLLSGHREAFDLRSVGLSAVGGFAGGAAGSAVVPGLSSGVVSRSVRSATSDVLAETAASLAVGQGLPALDDVGRSATSGASHGALDSPAPDSHHGTAWRALALGAVAAGGVPRDRGVRGGVDPGADVPPDPPTDAGGGRADPDGRGLPSVSPERVGRAHLDSPSGDGRGLPSVSPERGAGRDPEPPQGRVLPGASPERFEGSEGLDPHRPAAQSAGLADPRPGHDVAEPTAAHLRPAPVTAPAGAHLSDEAVAPAGIGGPGAPAVDTDPTIRPSDGALVTSHSLRASLGEIGRPPSPGHRSPAASAMFRDPTPDELRAIGLGGATYADLGLDPDALGAAERARYDRLLPRVALLPPARLRYTQRSVSPTTRDGTRLGDLAARMRERGWRGEPIHGVRWGDGSYVTLDNRRPRAAREAGLDLMPVVIHTPSEPLSDWPDDWPPDRIARNALTDQIRELPDGTWKVGGDEGTVRYDRGTHPQTFAEAALFRAAHQRSLLPPRLFGAAADPVVVEMPDQVPRSPNTGHLRELAEARRTMAVAADAVQADIEEAAQAVSVGLGSGHRLELKGLAHRIKSLDSLARKYADEGRANQMSVAEFLADTKDVLRFSLLMPEGDAYTATVRGVLRHLDDRGYRIGRVKNYWRQANRFHGLNVEVRSPDDQRFEIQFPTHLSWRAGRLTHDLYSVVRHDGSTGVVEPPARRIHAFLRMLAINKEVGVGRNAPPGGDHLAPAHDASFIQWIKQKPEVWVQYQRWLAANSLTFAGVAAEFDLDSRDLGGQIDHAEEAR